MRRSRIAHAWLCVAAGVSLVPTATPAVAASPPPSATGLRVIGEAPIIPDGARPASPIDSTAPVSFTVALKPRDPAALDDFVRAVSSPGSPQYRHFLAKGEFGPRFGATPHAIAAVTARLRSLGLSVSLASSNDLLLEVSGPAQTVERAFHTSLKDYALPSGRVARANTSAPELPADIAPLVQSVVGLDNIAQLQHSPIPAAPKPLGAQMAPAVASSVMSAQATGPQQLCVPAGSPGTITEPGYLNPDQLASFYGLTPYYTNGYLGSGTTVALVEFEPFSNSDIAHYQTCLGTSTSVTRVDVDGGPGTGAGEGESALDIEDVIGLAPAADISVYESPNLAANAIDLYDQIASDDTADIVSISWGLCEAATGTTQASAERTAFQAMAANGQTVFASSGDDGSEGCYDAEKNPNATGLAVSDPASQPEVTSVGGTYITGLTDPEQVWNESAAAQGAGGGGITTLWDMPAWQDPVGVMGASSNLPCGAPAGSYCREVPDVSASADPATGYPVYWSSPKYGANWFGFGGTSAAAPTWGAALALVEPACATSRLGLINPALYQMQASGGSQFNDVTIGNNDYTGDNGGAYAAAAGYDLASGLGTFKASALGAALCPATAGEGAMAVAPDVAALGAGNSLTFTYTAPTDGGLSGGTVTLTVPAGWSAPSTIGADDGFTTASRGVVSVSGSTIIVSGITAIAGDTVTITYGDRSQGGVGATAPAIGTYAFDADSAGTASDTAAALAASPSVDVWTGATDGSGRMAVAPGTVNAAASTTLTFTYAPLANTTVANGEVDVVVPSGLTPDWTTPQDTDSSAAGYVTASGGSGANTVAINGNTIEVSSVGLAPTDELTITYANAVAPNADTPSAFDTWQKATAGGTLTKLSPSLTVHVQTTPAADGSGTMTVSPSAVTVGASTTLTFTYTPKPGTTLTGREVDVTVPANWTTPTDVATDPGYVSATVAGVAAAPGTVNIAGNTIAVTGVTLTPTQTVVITYKDATPSATGVSTFTSAQGAVGSPANLTTSPKVTVNSAGGGGGGGGGGLPPSGTGELERIAGADRIATSIAASQAAFPHPGSADVVVLARSDSYADALSGTPLAIADNGPLLLTTTASLQPSTLAEIERVLPAGRTVYILGGVNAIGAPIETTLADLGYYTYRFAGADRYATAAGVASQIPGATMVFEASGMNFPDALSAGAAAGEAHAIVLLTAGTTMPEQTKVFLDARPALTRYAIGGPAAAADPIAIPIVGNDRYATSLLVAQKFFPSPFAIGLASGVNFPDALSGGVVSGLAHGPLLLVSPNALPAEVTPYLTSARAGVQSAWMFGGTAAVSDEVFEQAKSLLFQ